jgi:hypothetical protein
VVVIRGLLSGNGVHRDLQQQASAMFSEVISRVWEDATVDFAFIECKDSEASRRVVNHFNNHHMGNVVLRGMPCSASALMRARSHALSHAPSFFNRRTQQSITSLLHCFNS